MTQFKCFFINQLHIFKKIDYIQYTMHFNISLFLLFVIFLTACKKTPNDPDPHVNTFSAIVNGTPFIPTSIDASTSGSSIPGIRPLNVAAKGTNGHGISVSNE
jgi:hypothetical protein